MESFFNEHKKQILIAGLAVLVFLLAVCASEYIHFPQKGEKVIDPAWYEIEEPILVRISHVGTQEVEVTRENGTVEVYNNPVEIEDGEYEISREQLQAFLDHASDSTVFCRKLNKVKAWKDQVGEMKVSICCDMYGDGDPVEVFWMVETGKGRHYFGSYRCIVSDKWYDEALALLDKTE